MNILVIAPHPDDELIGVAGTIAKKIKENHSVYICIVTRGKEPLFDAELIEKGRKEAKEAHQFLGIKETFFLDFPAVELEKVPRYKLNGEISEIIQQIKPEEVYIPHRGDMQLDHQLVVDAAMVALRPKYKHVVKRIYAYETLSETGWNIPNIQNEFIPNVYIDISGVLRTKILALGMYESQLELFPNTRSLGAMEALAHYRGATIGVIAAEAFVLIREIK